MIEIKLMADYQCFPLWYEDIFYCDNGPNIDPANLNISKTLVTDLELWAKKYDDTLNHEDPVSSRFKTDEDERCFLEEGKYLSKRLQEELGNQYRVIYNY